eukprot:gene17022-biopygen15869
MTCRESAVPQAPPDRKRWQGTNKQLQRHRHCQTRHPAILSSIQKLDLQHVGVTGRVLAILCATRCTNSGESGDQVAGQ